MNRLKITAAVAVVGVVAGIWLTSKKRPKDPRAALFAALEQMIKAAEEHRIKDVKARIDDTYADKNGRSAAKIRQYLALHLLRRLPMSIYVTSKDAVLEKNTAIMRLKLIIARGPKVTNLSTLAQGRAVALALTLDWRFDDEWRISGATWKRLNLAQLITQ